MFELRTAKVFVLLVSGDLSSKLGGVFRLIEEAVLRKIYSICDLVFVKQVVVVGGAFAVEKALLFELFSIDCTRLEVIALGRFGRVFLLRVEVQKINRPGIRNIVFKIETLPKIFFLFYQQNSFKCFGRSKQFQHANKNAPNFTEKKIKTSQN